ncbi:MAG: AFG1 family ATPase [Alphaproteobacteria bacterium]|nr:AFG1 family ATPase [Alphaproteobacteria bacterium]
MQKTPLRLYKEKLKYGMLQSDPVQEGAVVALDDLFHRLMSQHEKKASFKTFLQSFTRASEAIKGLYMYGGVGRGKSMLMDLFFEALPGDIKKRRVHFHAFMVDVHDYFHSRRESDDFSEGVDGLIPSLASLISARSHVLCFDEFHVTDVADAMILGRLFTALFDRGVVVVATSNWEPDKLYEGGLQRERFLPFIELLKSRMDVLHIDSETDYRRQFLSEQGCYFWPLGPATTTKANELFIKLTQGKAPYRKILKVKGRNIVINRAAEGVARFTFAQLCETPHGAEDYLKIAEEFQTVFLENIPKLNYDRRNEAKRLMTLVDALYDTGTKLVVTADAPAEELYLGHDHEFEFQRTVSRLIEMQNM